MTVMFPSTTVKSSLNVMNFYNCFLSLEVILVLRENTLCEAFAKLNAKTKTALCKMRNRCK